MSRAGSGVVGRSRGVVRAPPAVGVAGRQEGQRDVGAEPVQGVLYAGDAGDGTLGDLGVVGLMPDVPVGELAVAGVETPAPS